MACGKGNGPSHMPCPISFGVDTFYVRTYYVHMGITNITFSVNEETLRNARRRADSMGKSVNQLVREYLEQLAGRANRNTLADELEAAWRHPQGNSRGWKFNREELHERR